MPADDPAEDSEAAPHPQLVPAHRMPDAAGGEQTSQGRAPNLAGWFRCAVESAAYLNPPKCRWGRKPALAGKDGRP